MTSLHHVKKARKAQPGNNIEIGDSYYWWQFAFGRKQSQKTKPRRSQLTQSDFLGQLYDLEDSLQAATDPDDVISFLDSVRVLGDEQLEKLQNMPEQLQYSPSGETLQERADAMEEWASEIEGVDKPDELGDHLFEETEAYLEAVKEICHSA